MKRFIKNFVDCHPICVDSNQLDKKPLVLITQSVGAMSFQHAMTPRQARDMAGSLMLAATESESLVLQQDEVTP